MENKAVETNAAASFVEQNPDKDTDVTSFLERFVDVAPFIDHVRFQSDDGGKHLCVFTDSEIMAAEAQKMLPHTFEEHRVVIMFYSGLASVVEDDLVLQPASDE